MEVGEEVGGGVRDGERAPSRTAVARISPPGMVVRGEVVDGSVKQMDAGGEESS